MSLANVARLGPAVEVAPEATAGWAVALGTGGFVGSGSAVGKSASVAVATGEQAANPLSTPSEPIFNTSLRESFFVIRHL